MRLYGRGSALAGSGWKVSVLTLLPILPPRKVAIRSLSGDTYSLNLRDACFFRVIRPVIQPDRPETPISR